MVRGELHIPEEALKVNYVFLSFHFISQDSRGSLNSLCQHEKLSSQLQLSQKKPPAVESSKPVVKPPEAAATCEGATAKPPEDKMTGEVTVSRFTGTA